MASPRAVCFVDSEGGLLHEDDAVLARGLERNGFAVTACDWSDDVLERHDTLILRSLWASHRSADTSKHDTRYSIFAKEPQPAEVRGCCISAQVHRLGWLGRALPKVPR